MLQIKNVLIALIDRLAIYTTSEGGKIPDDLPLFDIFSKQAGSVIESRQDMPPEDIAALQVTYALLDVFFYCYHSSLGVF